MSEDLGRYSKVYRRVWRDEKFRSLSDRGKLLFLRFMTAPELGSIPGLVIGTDVHFARTLGWDTKAFGEAFGEAFAKGMVKADWESGLVWLPRATRYNRPESPNVVRGWRREWPEIPECELKRQAFRALKAFAEGFGKAFAEAFAEAFRDPSPNQEQEQEQEQDLYPGVHQEPTETHRTATAGDATTTEEPIETQASHDAFQLSVQKRPKKSKDNLRHVGPDTPVAGLDQVDRCRRRFAVEWRAADRYNGTAYPDSPGADRTAIGHVLGYHRRNKIEEEWQSWMLRVFQAYLEIADDRYILNACHPLALLPRNLPRIVTAMKEQG